MSNELLDAMRRASETGDPDARRGIYRAFAQPEVLVPTRGVDGEGRLVAVEARDGSPVALAFTDVDAFANWAEGDSSWGSLRGSDLCALVLGHGGTAVIVNPHGPFGGQLGRRELELVGDARALDVEQMDGAVATLAVRDPSQLSSGPPRGYRTGSSTRSPRRPGRSTRSPPSTQAPAAPSSRSAWSTPRLPSPRRSAGSSPSTSPPTTPSTSIRCRRSSSRRWSGRPHRPTVSHEAADVPAGERP
jgi:SseB protein N-terminal domain